MKFFFSWETERSSADSLRLLSNKVGECIVRKLDGSSSLISSSVSIDYVPIVMSDANISRYPARSRLNRKKGECICAPQLEYNIFLSGEWDEMLKCYLDGIRGCAKNLKDIGLSREMVQEFMRILDETENELLK